MHPSLNRNLIWIAAIALVASACAGGVDVGENPPESTSPTTTGPATAPAPTTTSNGGSATTDNRTPEVLFATEVWPTDWANTTIDLSELKLGIGSPDPRDLIRPLDEPAYETGSSAAEWMNDREIGISVSIGGLPRFYPLRILTSHEIVNDRVNDIPYSVTYCPLCNTGVVFDRRVGDQVLRFGVSGLLRNSDLVMWDSETVSLWQQITGEGIVGEFAGVELDVIPSAMLRWADFMDAFPEGEVLSRNTEFGFAYESNAYVGYTSRPAPIGSFFDAELDDRFPALERVVGVDVDDEVKAFPFSILERVRAVNDEIGGEPIAVWWAPTGAADNFDGTAVGEGRDIGTGIAFSRRLDGDVLTFEASEGTTFVDLETGSTWNILGAAISGPLEGSQLALAQHQNEFWFAWSAFHPGAAVADL
ncbi:MAG: DUF3179 domain-containing protein [Acidimicrobiia bacterium]|nr:DUF3179 domain-containing protein [Acidimicrobiia bacterium]